MEPVRFGILGAAKIARERVVPAMQRSALTSVVAIASRDEARARAAAADLGIETAYGSYEELLADPAIEAVYNPLPNHLHVPWSLRALEAGKHVLCEKPIALTAAEAERLVEAERRTGRRVVEAFMVRHHPQWLRARELVRAGAIGEARLIQAAFTYNNVDPDNVRNKADIGGGGLYDIGCYPITGARFLFEAEPERVIGVFDLDPVMKTDRLASAILVFPGGRQLVFSSATQLAPHQRFQMTGTRGRLEFRIPFNPPPDRPAALILDDCRDLFGGGRSIEEFAPVNQYTLQGEAFARFVRSGEALAHPVSDAVAGMRIIDALFRSGRSGRWEDVNE